MKKTFRVSLLIGLILSTILYSWCIISSFIGFTSLLGYASSGNVDNDFVNNGGIAVFFILGIMLIFCILGVIFSGVSFSRVSMSPEKFQYKKGLPITVVVFNFIFVGFYLLYLIIFSLTGIIASIDIFMVIWMLCFIASSVLIIVDLARNKSFILKNENQTDDKENLHIKKEEEKKELWFSSFFISLKKSLNKKKNRQVPVSLQINLHLKILDRKWHSFLTFSKCFLHCLAKCKCCVLHNLAIFQVAQ